MSKLRRLLLRRLFPDVMEALIWMTGSSDFGPGGKAERGFDKLVRPILR